jgi:hypothetical protein
MRKQQITITVDKDLRGVLEENAEREGRSLANYTRLLIERGVRAEAAAAQASAAEQRPAA